MERLSAISLWQPWASLWLADDVKIHETRGWRFPSRLIGKRILVHAALKRISLWDLDPSLAQICRDVLGPTWWSTMPRGGFLGTLIVSACKPTTFMGRAQADNPLDWTCGDWSEGRFAWRGDHRQRFPVMVSAKGHQGFWTPADI
jgi:hypothetical protein